MRKEIFVYAAEMGAPNTSVQRGMEELCRNLFPGKRVTAVQMFSHSPFVVSGCPAQVGLGIGCHHSPPAQDLARGQCLTQTKALLPAAGLRPDACQHCGQPCTRVMLR